MVRSVPQKGCLGKDEKSGVQTGHVGPALCFSLVSGSDSARHSSQVIKGETPFDFAQGRLSPNSGQDVERRPRMVDRPGGAAGAMAYGW